VSHTEDVTANGIRCILIALTGLVLLSCGACQLFFPFRRNPNLRLLRGERGEMGSGSSLSRPVISPDGTQVYFLSWRQSPNIERSLGTLWRMGFNDTSAVQVLPDTFSAMAISPDGRTMVLGNYGIGPSSSLVTLDLGNSAVETIPSEQNIDAWDVEFSRTAVGRVYYTDRTGLHRIDAGSGNDVLVDSTVRRYFDLTSSDSVIPGLRKPKVSPDGRYVACVVSHDINFINCDIALVDLSTKDTTLLHANPYKPADMGFPYWTPDGRALVFAAAEWRGEPHGTYPAELWVLDDVFKSGK
jgi:hypothetical protein